jgi:hypothetical protein
LAVGSFGYFVLSFMGMVFGSFGSFDQPDIASLNFELVWIGMGAFFVGMILFALGGGLGVMRMFRRKSTRK